MNQETAAIDINPNKGDAVKAALLSAVVVPGAGQIFNKEWLKGLLLAVLFLVASLSVLVPITLALVAYYLHIGEGNAEAAIQSLQIVRNSWIYFVLLIVASGVVYIYSIVDAYKKRLGFSNTGDER